MLNIAWNFLKGILLLTGCTVESFFQKDIHVQSRIYRKWAGRILHTTGVPWEVRGLEHLEGVPPGILVSNHQSSLDIPLIYAAVPRTLRMVAKVELLKVPFIGWMLRRGRFVTVHRRQRDKAVRELSGVEWLFTHGADLFMAAEGTRSLDGNLRPFKKGPFVLAVLHQVPLIPITVVDTRRAMPKHALAPRSGVRVACVIHPPVYPSGLTYDDREILMNRVRDIIQKGLDPPLNPLEGVFRRSSGGRL